jgi:hypothetical protein
MLSLRQRVQRKTHEMLGLNDSLERARKRGESSLAVNDGAV